MGWLVSLTFWVVQSWGIEEFVVGGKEHPWQEWGTAPGEVIDFSTEPGSIRMVQIDPKENIALGTYERGGKVEAPNVSGKERLEEQLRGTVNGDHTVAFERKTTEAQRINPLGVILRLDLGAKFGVDRIRFYPRNSEEYPYGDDFLRAFEVAVNDGSEEMMVGGIPLFKVVARVEENREPVVDLSIPLQYVRYLQIKSLTTYNWEIDEIEIYGRGFVPEARYLSKVLDVKELTGGRGELATWGKIWWVQRKEGDPGKSKIWVRTRTGSDDTPLVYYRVLGPEEEFKEEVSQETYEHLPKVEQGGVRYFSKDGRKISEGEYMSLPEEERGPVKYYRKLMPGEEVPFDKDGNPLTEEVWRSLPEAERGSVKDDLKNWSPWSQPYDYEEVLRKGGTFIRSPAPRRYIQFMIDFKSYDLNSTGVVDSLGFTFSAPSVAHSLIGEIFPGKVRAGEPTKFTYAVLVHIDEGDIGFRFLTVETPTRVDSVEEVRVDGERLPEGKWSWSSQEDRFTVSFPKVAKDRALLEVVFWGTALRYGTTFTGWAAEEGELPLMVVPGDAKDFGPGDTDGLSVRTELGGGLIRPVEVLPPAFTPNGDGVQDEVTFSYDILQLTRRVPCSVEVYELSGAPVRELFKGMRSSGRYRDTWDGRDDEGKLVPPGVYLVRVRVRTDSGTEVRVAPVSVVY